MNHSEAGKLGAIKSKEVWANKKKYFVEQYQKNPNRCKFCEKILDYEKRRNKFCDHVCSAKYNNLHNERSCNKNHKQSWKEKYELSPKFCTKCGCKLDYELRHNVFCKNCCDEGYKSFQHLSNGSCLYCGKECGKTFCNSKCMADLKWKQLKEEMEASGRARAKHTAKRYLLEKEPKCKICGISEWCDKKLPLILDHIDGNSDNWNLDNLRLVCSNCDSLLPTYKGKNKGKGRYSRKMRYREGKSF
jgi:hypothetical protein